MALNDEIPEGNDDLRATIAAQFDEPTEVASDAIDTSPGIEPAADADAPASAASLEDHPTDPARYANGKFKPTKSEAAPEKAAPETVSPSVDTQTKASEVAATPTDAPPAGWTADGKAAWSALAKELPSLPPAAQAAVRTMQMAAIKREEAAAIGSEQKRHYEQILSPLAQEAARLGIPVDQGLNALLAAHHMLNRDPVNAIRHLARERNIDLATLAGQAPSEAPQGQDISALVRQHVQPFLAPIQERFQAEEYQKQQQTVDFVTEFAASPGHEHFDTVQSELMALIPQIKSMNPNWSREKILQDAYDRAVFANPTTRQAQLAARDAQADEKRKVDAAAHAKKARLAASSVTGSPSGTPAAHVPDSIRGAIEQAWSGSP